MTESQYPSLFQVNTRVWLTALSRQIGKRATLDDVPDAALDKIAAQGFQWVWLLSVWQTGPVAQKVSRSNVVWRHEFEETLPDLTTEDIGGSGFAITGYTVHADLGGNPALARLRERMRLRNLKLMLDFVPNHMAPDHPWVEENPAYFVSSTEEDLARSPQNFFRVGERIFAYGRDPYFAGWPDTIQLNYANPRLQDAMMGELSRIATQCDGLRCDMAMLVLPDVFHRTWNLESADFWPRAIARVRDAFPNFVLMAEVYWDLEWRLQQDGFSYTYDKRLYDRLRDGHARPVREHLMADANYQARMARFLENHDEPRAAAVFEEAKHKAAAIITHLVPGLHFFHDGELEGKQKRISPHLIRGPEEPVNHGLADFYGKLLPVLQRLEMRFGHWKLLKCLPAWDGNWTHDCFVAFAWEKLPDSRLVVAVNFSDHRSQTKVVLPFPMDPDDGYRFRELISKGIYDWPGSEIIDHGLYVDLPAWGTHVFSMETLR